MRKSTYRIKKCIHCNTKLQGEKTGSEGPLPCGRFRVFTEQTLGDSHVRCIEHSFCVQVEAFSAKSSPHPRNKLTWPNTAFMAGSQLITVFLSGCWRFLSLMYAHLTTKDVPGKKRQRKAPGGGRDQEQQTKGIYVSHNAALQRVLFFSLVS